MRIATLLPIVLALAGDALAAPPPSCEPLSITSTADGPPTLPDRWLAERRELRRLLPRDGFVELEESIEPRGDAPAYLHRFVHELGRGATPPLESLIGKVRSLGARVKRERDRFEADGKGFKIVGVIGSALRHLRLFIEVECTADTGKLEALAAATHRFDPVLAEARRLGLRPRSLSASRDRLALRGKVGLPRPTVEQTRALEAWLKSHKLVRGERGAWATREAPGRYLLVQLGEEASIGLNPKLWSGLPPRFVVHKVP